MYNIYRDQKKIGQTKEKNFVVDGLEPDTEYTLGVSKVEGDKESAIVEVEGRTLEHEESVEEGAEDVGGEAEGLSISGAEEQPTGDLNDVSMYHVGGGYYELPSGEKVRGKEAAQLKLNEM